VTSVAFDTSLAVTTACVVREDGSSFATPPPPPQRLLAKAAHSQELLPELDRLIDESGTGWNDVESIAIGVGPGTFTGLRIGVATARALGQSLGIGLKPVSSLEALAEGLAQSDHGIHERPLLAVIDARRGQVFAALYRTADASRASSPEHERLAPVWEPMVLDPDALVERIRQLDAAPVCVGDWALESREYLEDVGVEIPAPDSGLHAVNALHVYRLGTRLPAVPPSDVNPVYLRLPDAELTRQRGDGTRDR
jgi:tRNA threonylcarbamoyladenosine biosynthesis protein TsaB